MKIEFPRLLLIGILFLLPSPCCATGFLEVLAPAEGKVVPETTVTVSGMTGCDSGIEVFSVGRRELKPREPKTHFSVTVPLDPGFNRIPVRTLCTDGAEYEQAVTIISDVTGPQIYLEQPSEQAENDKYIMNGEVVEEHARLLSVTVNGREMPIYADSKNLLVSEEIRLTSGENIISVIAVDTFGNRSEQKIKIIHGDVAVKTMSEPAEPAPAAHPGSETASFETGTGEKNIALNQGVFIEPPQEEGGREPGKAEIASSEIRDDEKEETGYVTRSQVLDLKIGDSIAMPLEGGEIRNGSVYLPIGELLFHFDSMSSRITNYKIVISIGGEEAELQINEIGRHDVESAAYFDSGVLKVPLRQVLEKLGYAVEWNAENHTVAVLELPTQILGAISNAPSSTSDITPQGKKANDAGVRARRKKNQQKLLIAGEFPKFILILSVIFAIVIIIMLVFAFEAKNRYLNRKKGRQYSHWLADKSVEVDTERFDEFILNRTELTEGNDKRWREILHGIPLLENGGGEQIYDAFRNAIRFFTENHTAMPFVGVRYIDDSSYTLIKVYPFEKKGKFRHIPCAKYIWVSPEGEYICTKASGESGMHLEDTAGAEKDHRAS